jgi:hypothetical protein
MNDQLTQALNQGYSHADRDAETFAFLGGGVNVNSLHIPPPTPGVISLLEMHGSPFISGCPAGSILTEDLYLTIFLLARRENGAFKEIDIAPMLSDMGEHDPAEVAEDVNEMFKHAVAGFGLLPDKKQPENQQRKFDAVWLSNVVSICSKVTNLTPFDIIWRLPLAAVGFYTAQLAMENGEKGVGRKQNFKAALDLIRQKREAQNNA